MSIESVMPSNHLILCRPLLLLPSIFPSIKVFSNESALCIRWPKHWSFSFNISPSNEHPGLISFRMDWLGLLAVQRTLKSLHLGTESLKSKDVTYSWSKPMTDCFKRMEAQLLWGHKDSPIALLGDQAKLRLNLKLTPCQWGKKDPIRWKIREHVHSPLDYILHMIEIHQRVLRRGVVGFMFCNNHSDSWTETSL